MQCIGKDKTKCFRDPINCIFFKSRRFNFHLCFLSLDTSVLSNSLGRSIEKTGKGLISKATSNKLVFIQLTCKNSLLNFVNFEQWHWIVKELFETSDHQGQTVFSTSGRVGFGYLYQIPSQLGNMGYWNLDRVFAEYLPYFLYFLISIILFD